MKIFKKGNTKILLWGGFVQGDFVLEGFRPGGFLSGGICLGGLFGWVCPRTEKTLQLTVPR